MRHTIALNGAFFNTQRMVEQYVHNAYRINGPYTCHAYPKSSER